METDASNPAEQLSRLIVDGSFSLDTLRSVTGIPAEKLQSFLDEANLGTNRLVTGAPTLTIDERARLSILAADLTDGLQIRDDDRMRAILESLILECGFTLPNISQLTGLNVLDLETAMRDPHALSFATKYALATRSSYLINAVNRARGR